MGVIVVVVLVAVVVAVVSQALTTQRLLQRVVALETQQQVLLDAAVDAQLITPAERRYAALSYTEFGKGRSR